MDLLRKIYFKFWRMPVLKHFAYTCQAVYSRLVRLKIKLLGLPELSTIYNKKFYSFSKEEVAKFVPEFVDIICKKLEPKSVIDIGCGIGLYLNEFDKKSVEVIGYDGSPHAIKNSTAKPGLVNLYDLRNEFNPKKKYDVAMSVEVAEHIPTKLSDRLVSTLVKSSDLIVLTAAQKGQGGTDHINEQPKSFWIEKFEKRGFEFKKELTNEIVLEMKKTNIPWWIYENFMVFKER